MKLYTKILLGFTLVSIVLSVKEKLKANKIKTEAKTETIFDFYNSFEGFPAATAPPPPKSTTPLKVTDAAPKKSGDISIESSESGGSSNSTSSSDPIHTLVVDLNDPNVKLEEWLTITSPSFGNTQSYPKIADSNGNNDGFIFGSDQERMNPSHESARKQGATNDYDFWFKARGGYIYYFGTKNDLNALGSVYVKNITNSEALNRWANMTVVNATIPILTTCFEVYDYNNQYFKICAHDYNTKMKWLCSIQKYLDNTQLDGVCLPPDQRKADYIGPESVILTKRIINPVIIIPTASRECNDKWTYESKGADWECICLDGKAQSPIDLPEKEKAVLSEEKPLFNYDVVSSKLLFSSEDGLLQSGKNLRILYDRNAIRIHHPNMGKIVQIDGAVYQAEEIVFHTPAEHTINGQKFDMEMQIIHYGVSKGDIARQAILSFIFKKKPSVYNKFIDKLDFFNLPNIIDTFRDITNDLFIPSVFYTTEDEDIPVIRPFSFYTYNGSISSPPCTERTTVYVVADPIHLSPTIISLFKEALKRPDMKNGDLIVPGSGDVENNRLPQPLNGRPVYLFDHIKFNCPEYRRPKRKIVPEGHYEKRDTYKTQYAWVNSNEPSGIPGAFVVSENEAKGLGEINLQISDPTV